MFKTSLDSEIDEPSEIRESEESSSRLKPMVNKLKADRDRLTFLSLISLLLQVLGLFSCLLLLGVYLRLSRRPVPTLVQLSDGGAVLVGEMGNLERSPVVIQRFVTDSLIALMSWQQKLPSNEVGTDGAIKFINDPGLDVSQAGMAPQKVTTRTWQASFAFAESMREEIMLAVAKMTPAGVFEGKVQTALVFQAITEPEQVKPGEWKVAVIGNLVQSSAGQARTVRIPFNKEVLVRAVDTPAPIAEGALMSPFEAAVYSIRSAGLEIYSMKDIR